MSVLISTWVNTNRGNLPDIFLDLLPDVCPSCGYPTLIRQSGTGLSCSAPRCPIKIASRMVALANRLGILGIGQSVAERIVAAYEIDNPFALLQIGYEGVEPYDNAPASLIKSISDGVKAFQSKPITLPEFVSLAFLPNVQSTALPLFKDQPSLWEAYRSIINGGVPYVQSALGISPDKVSLRANRVYESLLEFKQDLFDALPLMNLSDLSSFKHISLCISDTAGPPYLSKRDFMNQAQVVAENNGYYLNFSSSMTKTVDYLIHASARQTNKVQTAWRHGKPVISGASFIELLESKEA